MLADARLSVGKAIALAEKLLELPRDVQGEDWEVVHDLLQEHFLLESQFRFLERYRNDYVSFNLHIVLRHFARVPKRVNWRAVVEFDPNDNAPKSSIGGGNFVTSCNDSDLSEMSVFVDV